MSEVVLELNIGDSQGEALSPIDVLSLRNQLVGCGAEQVDFGSKRVEGVKSGEVISIASLTIAMLPVVFPEVIKHLRTWVGLSKDRRVRIRRKNDKGEIELEYNIDDISVSELQSLIEDVNNELE